MFISARNISNEFLLAFVQVNKIKKDELSLQRVRQSYYVRNPRILAMLEKDFRNFQESKLSLGEYFARTVIVFTNHNDGKYVTRVKKCDSRPILLFKNKNRNYQYDVSLDEIRAISPIKMKLDDILDIYGVPANYVDDPLEVEPENKVNLLFYRLYEEMRHNKKVMIGCKDSSVPGSSWKKYDTKIRIGLDENDEYYWLPNTELTVESKPCQATDLCNYNSKIEKNLHRHEQTCTDEATVTSKQTCYGEPKSLMKEIVSYGLLDKSYLEYRQEFFATYDLETLEQKSVDFQNSGTVTEAFLGLASIAVATNLTDISDETFPDQCYVKADDSNQSAQDICDQFLDHLFFLADVYQDTIPEEIHEAILILECEQIEEKFSKEKTKKQTWLRHLKKYQSFNCFGFNSGKFDIKVLLPLMMNYCGRHKIDMEPIKKGTSYMCLNLKNKDGLQINLKDILLFTSSMSLDKYLKTWNSTSAKSIFPYEYFGSMEQMRETTEFPPMEAFYSELKQKDAEADEYETAKAEYYRRYNLPESHPDKMENMVSWLVAYNLLDVGPLVKAISTSFRKFHEYFHVDPMLALSLPSLAFR